MQATNEDENTQIASSEQRPNMQGTEAERADGDVGNGGWGGEGVLLANGAPVDGGDGDLGKNEGGGGRDSGRRDDKGGGAQRKGSRGLGVKFVAGSDVSNSPKVGRIDVSNSPKIGRLDISNSPKVGRLLKPPPVNRKNSLKLINKMNAAVLQAAADLLAARRLQ